MIEVVEEAHEIVGDPPAGRMPADDLALHAVVGADLLGREAPKVEPRRRIGLRHGQIGQRDFVEALHLHRPERRTPGLVELFGGLIAPPQPVAERRQVLAAPGQHGAVAAVFVVGLPTGERRVPAVAPGERFDDARALAPIDLRREGVVPARAETRAAGPRSSTGAISGDSSISHFGGVAVGVPSTIFSPASASVSIARSSQSQANAAAPRLDSGTRRIRRCAHRRCRVRACAARPRPTMLPANVRGSSRRRASRIRRRHKLPLQQHGATLFRLSMAAKSGLQVSTSSLSLVRKR